MDAEALAPALKTLLVPVAPVETFARFQAGFLFSEDFDRIQRSLLIFIDFDRFHGFFLDFIYFYRSLYFIDLYGFRDWVLKTIWPHLLPL